MSRAPGASTPGPAGKREHDDTARSVHGAKRGREVVQAEGMLTEVDRATHHRARRREQGEARTLDDLVQLGQARGMWNPYGWARHVLAAREHKGAMAGGE